MNPTDTNAADGITWFVSRHQGAIEWARHRQLAVDRWVAHLDPAAVAAGDTVIGSLPVHLAAAVCGRGARYVHLTLEMPEAWRGRELTAAELDAVAARLTSYHVREIDPS